MYYNFIKSHTKKKKNGEKFIFTGPETSAWQTEFQAVVGRRRVEGMDVFLYL